MMLNRIVLIALTSLALWGCGSSDGSSAEKAVETEPVKEMDRISLLDCNQMPIKVIYHAQDSITLYLDRNQYELFPSRSTSGVRYATPAEGRQQIVFWSRGDEAMLERRGHAAASCRQIGEATTEAIKKKEQ